MRLISRRGELRSMSGEVLSWRQSVRVAYLDEAGVSNPVHEPLLIVSGVILDGDQDAGPIVRHLKSIARRHIPDEDRKGFVFHAADIFGGAKYYKKDLWPREKRDALLRELADIPRSFHLPVVVGVIDRRQFAALVTQRLPEACQDDVDRFAHAEAYMQAALEIDRWIRRNARSEVGLIAAEERPGMRGILNLIHTGALSDDDAYWDEDGADVFTLNNIIDAIHLLRKEDSPLLQVADVCAFIVKRYMSGKTGVTHLFDLLRGQLVSPPFEGVWQLPSEPMPQMFRITVPRRYVRPVQ